MISAYQIILLELSKDDPKQYTFLHYMRFRKD